MADKSLDRRPDSEMSYYIGNVVIIDGKLVGAWKRTFSKGAVVVEVETFARLTDAEHHALEEAANRYGEFLGMPVKLV